MLPPPPVAIFPPAAAMLPRGPPQFAAPYPPPIFYWPYPSPPVSPTNYYNPANVGGIGIPQQAALVRTPNQNFKTSNQNILKKIFLIIQLQNNYENCISS